MAAWNQQRRTAIVRVGSMLSRIPDITEVGHVVNLMTFCRTEVKKISRGFSSRP